MLVWNRSFLKKIQRNLININLILFLQIFLKLCGKRKIKHKGTKCKKSYEVADVENLDKFKGQFDIVLCHNVLYHAEDKNKALKI